MSSRSPVEGEEKALVSAGGLDVEASGWGSRKTLNGTGGGSMDPPVTSTSSSSETAVSSTSIGVPPLLTGLPSTTGSELFWLTFPNTLFPITLPPNTFFATLEFTLYVPTLFSLAASPVVSGFSVGKADPLDDDIVGSTVFVSGCLPFTDEDVPAEDFEVRVTDPVFFKPLPIPTRPTVLATPFPFSFPFLLPPLLALSITIVVVLEVEAAVKPMLVFGRDGMGAFNRSKTFDKLTTLAGLWYPVDGDGRVGLGVLWLDIEESIEPDEVAEVMELLDAVRAI